VSAGLRVGLALAVLGAIVGAVRWKNLGGAATGAVIGTLAAALVVGLAGI
jgi:hypothetical protein